MAWLVAYCEARREFYAKTRLAEQGIAVFCPFERVKVRRRVHGNLYRVREEDRPLYPRYLFANGEPGRILRTRGIMALVGTALGPLVMSAEEMGALLDVADDAGMVGEGDYISNTGELRRRLGLRPREPLRGKTFVIAKESPFGGFVARISAMARLDSTGQLRALVEMFGRQVPVDLPLEHVNRVSLRPT